MSDTVNVIGVRADGSGELLGTAPIPPAMKRGEIVRSLFGEPSPGAEDGTEADMCIWALEQYHEWLVEQGWQAPPLTLTPNS